MSGVVDRQDQHRAGPATGEVVGQGVDEVGQRLAQPEVAGVAVEALERQAQRVEGALLWPRVDDLQVLADLLECLLHRRQGVGAGLGAFLLVPVVLQILLEGGGEEGVEEVVVLRASGWAR